MKNFSRQNIIDIFKGLFPNKKVLDNLTESTNGNLSYNGKEVGAGATISSDKNNAIKQKPDGLFVQDLSSHVLETIYSESGSHSLRYYENKLQYYYDNKWNDISTGGNTTIITNKDIVLSPTANNALVKYSNGYYVQSFLISSKINNKLKEQNQAFNERYDIITDKIQEISANTTKHRTHEFSGINTNLTSVIDISSLYNLTSDVILSLEFMINNNSNTDILTIKILENEIETLNDTLTKSEVQRYKLPNIPNIEIFIQGNYDLFLYVNYI